MPLSSSPPDTRNDRDRTHPGAFWCAACNRRVYVFHAGCWHCGGPVQPWQDVVRRRRLDEAAIAAGAAERAVERQTFAATSPDPGPGAMD